VTADPEPFPSHLAGVVTRPSGSSAQRALGSTTRVWYKPGTRMTSHTRTFPGSDAACGWSFYARFYAWRFS